MSSYARPTIGELRTGEAAAWGPPPSSPPATDKIQLLAFKPYRSGPMRGHADVKVPSWHLIFYGCTVHVDGAKGWVNLPSKPQIDSATHRQRTTVGGKPEWTATARWDSRAVGDRFSQAVIQAIRARYPGALDD